MDSYLALFDLLGVLARRRFLAADRAFAALGLNHTEARLLRALAQAAGPLAQEALAAVLTVDRSNAARALKRLEAEGFLERDGVDADKRRKVARITAKGRQAVSEIAKLRNGLIRDYFGPLSEAEAAAAVKLLSKVAGNE